MQAELLPAVITDEARQQVRELLPELPAYIEAELRNLSDDTRLSTSWKARNLTAEEKATACRVYAETGSMVQAAEKISGSPTLIYRHLELDPDFRSAFSLAKMSLGDKIQTTSVRRALHDNGVVDRMCQLKRFFPSVYRESQQTIAVGVSVNLNSSVAPSSIPPPA